MNNVHGFTAASKRWCSLKTEASLQLLYGADALRQAQALVNRDERFFGLGTLGLNMEGSDMHQRLLTAYRKVWN